MAFLGKGPTYGSFEKQSLVVDGILTIFNSSIVVSTSAKNIPLTDNDMSFDLGPTTLPDHRPPAQATRGNQLCQQ